MLFQFIKNQHQSVKQLLGFMTNQHFEEDRRVFLERNPSQSESNFITICFPEPCSKQQEVALAIRRAIALLGNIESEFIRAEVSFEELGLLPFWNRCGDAGFNTPKFTEAIQSELQVYFTDEQLCKALIRDPDLNTNMKIYEFINEFYSWYKSLSI